MKSLEAKLEIMVKYYTEIQTALFWHRNLMSRTREKNKYLDEDDYTSLLVHWQNRANDAREARNGHLLLARKFKEKLDTLKYEMLSKPGLYCNVCCTRLMVRNTCTVFCPNKGCGAEQ